MDFYRVLKKLKKKKLSNLSSEPGDEPGGSFPCNPGTPGQSWLPSLPPPSWPARALYKVDAVLDEWSYENANKYAKLGYIHYHELVSTSDGTTKHPSLVVWLRHRAVTEFTLDGGPHPELSHPVTKGVDYMFIPNYFNQY